MGVFKGVQRGKLVAEEGYNRVKLFNSPFLLLSENEMKNLTFTFFTKLKYVFTKKTC